MTNPDSLVEVLLQRTNGVHYLRCDGQGQILACSDSPLPGLGLDREELVGRFLWDLLEANSAESLRQKLAQAPQGPVEQSLRWSGGPPMSFWLAGNRSGFALLREAQDLLHEREGRLSSEGANLLKAQFLANMSHEIRTPLNAITGMAHLMLKTSLTLQQREYMRHILGGSQALLRIVNDILDFSKMDSGQVGLKPIEFQMQSVVNELSSQLGPQALKKGLALSIALRPDVPTRVVGDPVRLHQLLLTLLENAIKFTDRGQVSLFIDTQAAPVPGQVGLRFQVVDSGIGMSAEQVNNLFQAFSQGDGSLTRPYGGTGLGLALCRQLVDLMQGDISVQSEPGQGSVFTIHAYFGSPTGPLQSVSWQTPPVDPRRPGGEGDRILVVEDNLVNQRIVSEMLQNLGFGVDIAANGRVALEQIMNCGPSSPWKVILMDLQMPEMDGYTAAQAIRKMDRFDQVPIIAMTAHVLPEERERCRACGMDSFLSKPIDPEVWFGILSNWLPIQQLQQTAAQIPFPRLPGFDVDGGLRRVAGNSSLYRALLVSFGERLLELAPDFEMAHRAQDLRRVEFLSHTLKGEAGNLGAIDLAL
ncbi:response regulator, partial [bacterium]|nr:response regulator [bacterium]